MALLAPLRRADRKTESGYVLATTALLLIPLMIFAAFAVDVGAWYAEADQAQRAADAAALAAGVEVPDAGLATAAAKAVAATNGYVDQPGCDDPTLPCTPAAYPQVLTEILSASKVKVTIITEGEAYFGKVVLDSIDIERNATVELTRPLPMGTPSNALGTGRDNVYRPGDPDNFWLNIHEVSTLRQYGDPLSIPLADNGNVNEQRDTRGFLYLMNIPAGSSGMRLQARVSCFDDSSSDLILNVYQPDATTPNNYYDNIVPANLATQASGSNSNVVYALNRGTNCPNAYDPDAAEEEGPWQNVVTNLTPGVWVVQAKSSNNGRLLYSLRVVGTSPAFTSCSTITNPNCPTLSPLNYLGVYTDQDMFPNSLRNGGGTLPGVTIPVELYLAEVGPENYRSTLEVTMFDTADGIDQVEVLMPPNAAGVRLPAPLKWTAIAESGYSEYVGTVLDGSNCINGPGTCVRREPLGGGAFFQDRLIRIEIDLNSVPGGYSCTTDCWVKIRYTTATSGVNLGETTAWRARIIGDPLRLVE